MINNDDDEDDDNDGDSDDKNDNNNDENNDYHHHDDNELADDEDDEDYAQSFCFTRSPPAKILIMENKPVLSSTMEDLDYQQHPIVEKWYKIKIPISWFLS